MAFAVSKRIPVVTAVIAAVFFCSCEGRDTADSSGSTPRLSETPHVVLIVLDTLRADVVGCYGGPKGVSPEIDALAASGVRFTRVVAPSNWTKPSWAGLLTGRYPRSLGVYKEIGNCLSDTATTLAERFKEAGYHTYGATANPNINSSFSYNQGFDTYIDSHAIWDWMEITGGEKDRAIANETALTPAVKLYERALDWASKQDGAACYIQICTMEMHEYHRGQLSLNRDPFSNAFGKFQSPEREYYQALQQSSHDLQQFLYELGKLPGWEDALVVVTSDHGEGLSSHPDVARSEFHGGVMYDSNLHVPLILYRPGAVPAGRVVKTPIRVLDIGPTILEIVGLSPPDGMDGVSVLPLANGAGTVTGLPDYFVSESELRDLNKIAITSGAWRYIENLDQANPENVQRGQMNPEELQAVGDGQNGKATDQIEQFPDVASGLRNSLRAWENAHPKAEPTQCGKPVTEEELRQLESIGYL